MERIKFDREYVQGRLDGMAFNREYEKL